MKKITMINRVLYLYELLLDETDEQHYLTTNEIIFYFKTMDVIIDRKTVKSLIEVLVDYGVDIVEIKSSPNKYYIKRRHFQDSEIKLLVDAVESSKFISKNVSDTLVRKLLNTLSRYTREEIKRHLYVANRIKTWNDDIYEVVDLINQAINREMQINFKYYDYNVNKEKILRNKGELYEVSPYALVWNDDRYYVVGFSKKYDKIVQFRVDRMYKPKVSQNDAIRRPDNFDVGEYSKQVIDMFPGIIENVILQCDNSLMKVMIDRFGEEIETQIFDSNSFILSIEISVSPTFYGWIFQFDNKVAILEPENVKNDYKTMIEKALLTQSN